jgi:O-methyltransferase
MKLHPAIRELARIVRHPVQYLFLRGVYNRIRQLEYRSFNRRYFAVEQVAEYLVGAQIPGDYCEFGVWQGTTFIHSYKTMSPLFPDMRFAALDSFEGLPEPRGIDAEGGYTSHFYKGQFESSLDAFMRNLRRQDVKTEKVLTVKGWFNETLTPERAAGHGIDKIAVAWIDCDLYESTIPVLDYLTSRVTVGSVLAFDDWHCYRNHPDFGQQRAVREWLQRNPGLSLHELFSFGWNGMVFTVGSC